MARVRSSRVTPYPSATNILTARLPEDTSENDLLLVFIGQDNINGSTSWSQHTGTSGWTIVGQTHYGTTSTGAKAMWAWKIAGAAESDPQFKCAGYSEESCCTIFAIQGADTIDPINTHGTFNGKNFDPDGFLFANRAPAITTDEDDCLVLFFASSDGPVVPVWMPDLGGIVGIDSRHVDAVGTGSAIAYQKTAGAAPRPGFYTTSSTNDESCGFSVAVNDSGDGYIQERPASDSTTLLVSPLSRTSDPLGGTIDNANPLGLGSINGKNTYSALVNNLALFGINLDEYGVGTGISNTTTMGGFGMDFWNAFDCTSGAIYVSASLNAGYRKPEMGTISEGGFCLSLGNQNHNAQSWVIGASDSVDYVNNQRNYAMVQPGQVADSSIDVTGVAPDLSAMDAAWFTVTRTADSANGFSAVMSQMLLVDNLTIVGGSSENPMGIDRFVRYGLNFYTLPMARVQGASSLMVIAPFTLGGSDPCHIDLDAFSIEFPQRADDVAKTTLYHFDTGYMGITVDASAGDTIRMTNGVISSPTQWHMNFAAGTSASATYDFSGLATVNADWTLQSTVSLSSVTFAECQVAHNGATLTACTFSDSLLTTADPSNLADAVFISGGSGHAIEITAPGTYSLDNLSFTGYGADDTSDAAIYNNSGGAVTLSVSGGSTPTVRNGAGASTTVQSGATLTLTGLQAGSDVVIRAAGTSTVLDSVDQNAGATWGYSYTATQDVDIFVHKPGYIPYSIRGYTLGSTNASIPVAQKIDRAYVE